MKLTKTTLISPTFGAGAALLCALATGCKKEDPPPPLPTPQPAATQETLQLKAIDAAVAPVDAGKKKPTGKGGGGGSIAACCAALQQNANLAPEPTKTYMMQAAAYCNSAQAGGQAALSMIRGMLRGANMPSACK